MSIKIESGLNDTKKMNMLVIPKLTTTDRDSLDTTEKTEGMMIYNLTTGIFEYWDGSEWKRVISVMKLVRKQAVNLVTTSVEVETSNIKILDFRVKVKNTGGSTQTVTLQVKPKTAAASTNIVLEGSKSIASGASADILLSDLTSKSGLVTEPILDGLTIATPTSNAEISEYDILLAYV